MIILLFNATSCISSISVTDAQLINQATQQNEQALLEKHNIIESLWFEKNCLQLVKKLKFNKISQCKVIDSNNINAYILANGHVYFSIAMMQQIKNQHQWASILAHENAHLELNHYLKTLKKLQKPGLFFPKSRIKKTLLKHEKQADNWAQQRLARHGLDPLQIYFFLQRVSQKTKNNNHLKPSKRSKTNKVEEIIDNELIAGIKTLQRSVQ